MTRQLSAGEAPACATPTEPPPRHLQALAVQLAWVNFSR
jgi:hypothetical protein